MPLHILVDGYNFLGVSERYDSWGSRLTMDRVGDLLEDLRRYKRIKGFKITVVFDGNKAAGTRADEHRQKGLSVIYTSSCESADDAIVRMARSRPEGAVVVTSDRLLSERCRSAGAAVITVAEFERRMDRAWIQSIKGGAEEDDEEGPRRSGSDRGKKGPSRRPARDQRKTKRWIDKL